MGRLKQPYPDTAEAVALLVESWYPTEFEPRGDSDDDYRTGRVFPQDLQKLIANGEFFCRVTDIGGNDDGITDRPLIDVDVLGSDFGKVRDLTLGIQAHLLSAPWRVGGVVLDSVHTAMRPHPVPWDDDGVFRWYSSYTVSVRR